MTLRLNTKPIQRKKNIPVDTSIENLLRISIWRRHSINSGVICRIDGFLTPDNRVILHDPTTPECPYFVTIQTNGGDWIKRNRPISYLIRQSVWDRIRPKEHISFTPLLNKNRYVASGRLDRPRKKNSDSFRRKRRQIPARKSTPSNASADYQPIPICVA
jgi:D-alanine-D-alanine ligase